MSEYHDITKPWHYNWHPSGVECKEICDDLPRWIGDAISYIWRRNHKGQPLDDRRKALERLNECTPIRGDMVFHIMQQESVGSLWLDKARKVMDSQDDRAIDLAVEFAYAMSKGMWCAWAKCTLIALKNYLENEIKELEKGNN